MVSSKVSGATILQGLFQRGWEDTLGKTLLERHSWEDTLGKTLLEVTLGKDILGKHPWEDVFWEGYIM